MRHSALPGTDAGSVPADDRGLAYGDGLFETMAAAGGQVRLLDYHLDRLCADAQRLEIPVDRESVESLISEGAIHLGDGVLKLLVTRGSGPRGYAPPSAPVPRILLQTTARAPGHADGWWRDPPRALSVRICETPLSVNPVLAGMKHLNRLPQVLARSEWSDPQIHEGLMRAAGRDGFVCATAANVFALHGDTVFTPSLTKAGVAGVMRRAVLEVADREGLAVTLQDLDLDFLLHRADAVLLSSALTGLREVATIDGRTVGRQASRERGGAVDKLRGALARRLGCAAT